MNSDNINLDSSWKNLLIETLSKPYFSQLTTSLKDARAQGKTIYPTHNQIFTAFQLTPLQDLKVVILGQDPYHNPGQAMGLSFSVPKGVKIPPSLKNVYKELLNDLGIPIPSHGDLSHWANQGVLLLNATLTVEHKSPNSHKKIGWQHFTDDVISKISETQEGIIFLLWGRFAQSKESLIDVTRHHILSAAHPSPLARGAFFGSKPFSKTNTLLRQSNKTQIQW